VQVRVGKVGMFEFHRADELIALGREAIRKAAAEIGEHVEPTRADSAGAVASAGPPA
jgi:NTE family protein